MYLFGHHVISVVHVVIFTKICSDLSYFCVKLHITVFLFPEDYGVLQAQQAL